MIQFIIIFLVHYSSQGQGLNSRQICAGLVPEIYKNITPQCDWTELGGSGMCSISCGHKDSFLNGFPFEIQKVYCMGGADYCNKNSQSCLEAQKEREVKDCENLPLEHHWKRDPSDPPPNPAK